MHLVMNSRVAALLGDGDLSGVEVENVETGEKTVLHVDGLFVAIGHESDNAPFVGIAETDAVGWFTAGEDCKTGTPGVFVAGDCRAKGVKQLITAAGDGASAATAACEYLNKRA